MMNSLPALIVVWAVCTGLFLMLLAYNSTITRYEENQLFLEDINANEKLSNLRSPSRSAESCLSFARPERCRPFLPC